MFLGHWWELLVLLFAALLIFGPKRLPTIGSSMGEGIKEFRKTIKQPDDEPTEKELPPPEQQAQIAGESSTAPGHAASTTAATPEKDAS